MSVDVRLEPVSDGWIATVEVQQGGRRTSHRVTVTRDDLARYRASDAADLVRRSFEFLLGREPNTSILREFRVTEIERYFPEFRGVIDRS